MTKYLKPIATPLALATLALLAGCSSTPNREPAEFTVVDLMYARYADVTTQELRRLANTQENARGSASLDAAARAGQGGHNRTHEDAVQVRTTSGVEPKK